MDPATAAMLVKYGIQSAKAGNEAGQATWKEERSLGTSGPESFLRAYGASHLGRIDHGLGLIGIDTNLTGLASSKKAKELQNLREYVPQTNLIPGTEEEIDSGLTMTGEPKKLTSIEGTTPYNKSANQHNSGLMMNKIAMSGISSKY
jgi:hypothetical protein